MGNQYPASCQDRYVYARDNPMRYVDPNGHEPHAWEFPNLYVWGNLILEYLGNSRYLVLNFGGVSSTSISTTFLELTSTGQVVTTTTTTTTVTGSTEVTTTTTVVTTQIATAVSTNGYNSCFSQAGGLIFLGAYSVGAVDLLLTLGGIEMSFGAALSIFGIGVPLLVLGSATVAYYYCSS